MNATPDHSSASRILTVQDGAFRRGGAEHRILSGAIHYFRVHPELWHDRLLRLRALGLNTIETYIPWNWHERVRGEIDFTGPRDVARFVQTAGDLGFDVILRPGPYICAEWDFGGLPGWLMAEPGIALRTMDPRFIDAADGWFDAITAVMRPLLASNGGPVVSVQVENEYGSFGDDAEYVRHCRDALTSRGIDVLLVTSDGPIAGMFAAGMVEGAHATVNFGSRTTEAFAALRTAQPEGPDMCMEFWNGWFDHWGEPHHVRSAADAAGTLEEMLSSGGSVNFYMAHGGTNFGLWNGCNTEDGKLQPTVTSYDYDAAVGEAGELSEKFYAFREILRRYATHEIPEPPALPGRLAAQEAAVSEWVSLRDSLGAFDAPERSALPRQMEQLGQDQGLVWYQASPLLDAGQVTLQVDGLADRATVLLDGVVAGIIDRNDAEHTLVVQTRTDGQPTELVIIVENQGRINFAGGLGEHKGLRSVRQGARFIHGWTSTALQIGQDGAIDPLRFDGSAAAAGPVFGRSTLTVDEQADGFIALPGWGKGFVWLNGFLLGRYWERGPQVTLYAPAPLWRAGENEIVVLEMERAGSRIELRSEPDLDGGRRAGIPKAAEFFD
ncbi:glycoside hydrolase family 35 protein [Microterricola viridarii]|nr:beta-galactosidase family protein [Microterricola viridarii]